MCSEDEADDTMDAVILHCLRHIGEAAACIKHNNDAAKADQTAELPRDQGFTRPKVQGMSKKPASAAVAPAAPDYSMPCICKPSRILDNGC